MVTYLEKNVCKIKASLIKDKMKVPVQRFEMPWRDGTNKQDCALYVMRHMETYYGNGMDGWETGLKIKDKSIFEVMRIRYCNTILDSPWNERKKNLSRIMNTQKKRYATRKKN